MTTARIGRLLRRCGDELGVASRATVSVRLTGDEELRSLNDRFLGVGEPTDVLAFPSGEAPRLSRRVGDIAISVERACQQNDDCSGELRLLAVHGLLHCLGYDHTDPVSTELMNGLTRRLLPDHNVPSMK